MNSLSHRVDIYDQMKDSYIAYAMSVIVSRALPDVRDGLKPVQRRIIYALGDLGLTKESKYRKCVKIVGDVMSNYHPHGDSSIYQSLVRMAQPFSLRYPLVDGQGNFGSIDGDNAAAMRYTEARMDGLCSELLKDINKDTVDFIPNFDGETKEPSALPARFPNLLVNGAGGIAVGMATNIPPHHLGEIIDAVIATIKNKDILVEELLKFVKGPDFPTGATILGHSFRDGYLKGRGKVVMRSKYHTEQHGNKTSIVVTEIPYQVNKARLMQIIAELVKTKKVDGITDLRDESNRDGIRIVLEIKRDASVSVIMNRLFTYSPLQTNFSMNMIALVAGEPKLLNLKELITYYIDHQVDVETRRIKFDLKKAEQRKHIVEGYLIAIDNIDEVIRIIRSSYDNAIERLIERFNFSFEQAKAIGDMRLIRLQGLEKEKLEKELEELLKLIKNLNILLEDENELFNLLVEHLSEVKKKYAGDRRTEIVQGENDIVLEDLIKDEPVTITITKQGYVKRIPTEEYSVQSRGGRGKSALSFKEEDGVNQILNCNSKDTLMIFTNLGKVYNIKAYEIPENKRGARGSAIINLIELQSSERIKAIIGVNDFENGFLCMQTKKGQFKRTNLSTYQNARKKGIIALQLIEGDSLIGVLNTNGEDEILVNTKLGYALRFKENTIRPQGRSARGVRGIKLRENDEVISVARINTKTSEEQTVLSISEKGYAKRTKIDSYTPRTRGTQGIKTYNVNDKTGYLIGSDLVSENDEVLLINSLGTAIRLNVSDISLMGRVTSGVKVMKLEKGDKIISFDCIRKENTEE